MADEQKPDGPPAPPPSDGEAVTAPPKSPAAAAPPGPPPPGEEGAPPKSPTAASSGAEGAPSKPEEAAPSKAPAAVPAKPPAAGDEAAASKTAAPPPPKAPAAAAPPKAPAAAGAPAKPAAAPGGHAAPPKAPAVMASTPWDGELAREIKQRFGDQISETSTYLGQNFVVCKPDSAIPLIEYLKLEADYEYLVDVTAVDWPKRPERFDLVYILYSFARNDRVRIKTYIADGYRPRTAVGVHLTANWLEREVFDMFGIEFAGHPDMRRILLPEEWDGHPLRKDYSIIRQDDRWVQENLCIESGQ